MTVSSSYNDSFKWNNRKPAAREEPVKRKDNIKSSHQPFSGTSSYANDFQKTTVITFQEKIDPHPGKYEPQRGMRPKSILWVIQALIRVITGGKNRLYAQQHLLMCDKFEDKQS